MGGVTAPPQAEVMGARDVARAVVRIAHEILERHKGGEDLYLVGIRRRGIPLANRLERAVRQAGRDVHQVSTDSSGVTTISLPPGRWWIQASVRDPRNPFLERYWSVPVTLTPLVAVVVPLMEQTAVTRWRH